MESVLTLHQQAGRLRFSDSALERRFQHERYEHALVRTRVLFVIAMVVVAALGINEVNMLGWQMSEFAAISLRARFCIIIPLYFLLLLQTWLPGHEQRADWVFGVGLTVVIWALALIKWFALDFFEWRNVFAVMVLDVMATLIISVLAVPMRITTIVGLCVASTGGVTLFFALTVLADEPRLIYHLGTTLGFFAVFGVVLQFFRERSERRMVAQREHVTHLNHEFSRLNKEKNEFMMIAAHDLRTPLAVVKAYVEMLEMDELTHQETSRIHRNIVEQVDCMLGLVNNYLGGHAIENGEVAIEFEDVDLWKVARRTQRIMTPRAQAKKQQIRFDESAPPLWVRADPSLLHQVVDNLVGNALKFSPEHAVVQLDLETTGEGSRAWGRFKVIDTGPGIPQAEQANVFRRFGRTSIRPTGGETSHGLGLALAKGIAERMGGRLGFQSTAGAGSTFWIDLVKAPTLPAAEPAQPLTDERVNLSSKVPVGDGAVSPPPA